MRPARAVLSLMENPPPASIANMRQDPTLQTPSRKKNVEVSPDYLPDHNKMRDIKTTRKILHNHSIGFLIERQ